MKLYLFIIFTLISTGVTSQKYALVGDKNRFLCKSDSIEFYFQKDDLEIIKVDTILELHYFYDNGRYEQEVKSFIWNENNSIKMKSISGCDETIETEILRYSNEEIFKSYFNDSLYIQNHDPEDYSWSHDFGYWFEIKTDKFKKRGYIRDESRGVDNFQMVGGENETEKLKSDAEINQLIKWLNEIDLVLNKQNKRN